MAERALTPEEIEANVAKAQAEAERARAEAEKLRHEAEQAQASAEVSRITLEREQHKRARELAADDYHHVYRFWDGVGESTVQKCISQFAAWHRLDLASGREPSPITLIFNSPGGSVIDGMALFDFIQETREAGHTVTTVAQGMAASMAGILLQAGDVRVMTSQAWLMIHQASYGAVGSHYKIEDTVKWVERIQERILEIFVTRAKCSGVAKPITKSTIKRNWNRKDWWITSDEALACGLIDRIDSALTVAE